MFYGDKKKGGGAVSMAKAAPDGTIHDDYEGGHEELLHQVAEELVSAIHGKDVKATAAALRAFLACDRAADGQEGGGEG